MGDLIFWLIVGGLACWLYSAGVDAECNEGDQFRRRGR